MPFAGFFPLVFTVALSFGPAVARAQTPAVVETGSDLELFTSLGNTVRPTAFDPAGNAYSLYENSLLKVAPDGTDTFVPINERSPATRAQAIIYSAGYLWFAVYHGYGVEATNGSNASYHAQDFTNPTAAPDGIYTTPGLNEIQHTDLHFRRTLFPVYLPGAQLATVGPMIYGPDGRLYFDVSPYVSANEDHLGRLETDGTVTVFSTVNPCGRPAKFALARNALYFIGYNSVTQTATLCRVSLGGSFKALSAAVSVGGYPSTIDLTADNDGDIWTVNLFGNGLYSYDIATSRTTGPYEPSVLNSLAGLLYTGPDENIYFYGRFAVSQVFFGCYVRHLETFLPNSVDLSKQGPFRDFYVTEPVRNERWYAVSLNPAVATVTPASSPVGRFRVTETGVGTTSIAVTDSYGNVRYEPVTAS